MSSKLTGFLYLTAGMPAHTYSDYAEIMMQLIINLMLLRKRQYLTQRLFILRALVR